MPSKLGNAELLALKFGLTNASPCGRVGGDTVEISFADWNKCRLLVDEVLAYPTLIGTPKP